MNEKITQLKTHPDWSLRLFTLDDAAAVVEIMRASAVAVLGYTDITLEDMLSDWTSPGVEFESTARVLLDQSGKLIGYCDVWDPEPPYLVKWGWVDIRPDLWEDAVALEMLRWSEEAARERVSLAPDGARVVYGLGFPHQHEPMRCLAEAAGMQLVRNYLRMRIDLKSEPVQLNWNGFHIRPMRYPEEFPMAIQAITEGFRDHWGHIDRPEKEHLAHWQHYVDNDPFFDPSLWFFAFEGDQLAGLCYCKAGMSEDPEMGWVSQLAVMRPFRHRGLGTTLLKHAFYELYQRDRRKVALNVDATNLTGATRLYEKAGMQVDRQYDIFHKELRPGRDLSTQTLDNTE